MQNIEKDIELFRLQQIESQIDKHKHILSEDPQLQCYLIMINTNLSLALKVYLLQLIDYSKSLPLPNNNQLAIIFSQSFIPTNTPFIQKFKQVKKVVEKVNQNVLNYFKKVYDEMRNQQQCQQDQIVKQLKKENDFSKCLCAIYQKTKTPKQNAITPIYNCFLCQMSFHSKCLRYEWKDSQPPFVCPTCVLKNLDPLQKVDQILAFQILETRFSAEKSSTLTFQVNNLDQKQSIDIRCMRLEGYRYQQQWPDKGDLLVNGSKEVQFKPLKINSSLKYRKDDFFKIRNLKLGSQRVVLRSQSSSSDDRKLFQIKTDQIYIFAAFLITQVNSNELIQENEFNKSKWVSIQQMKDNIYQYSNYNSIDQSDLVVNKISVSLICQITTLPMMIPCRGILCEHIQCFCLESFIKFMESLSQRKWSCPVCKRICLDFYIDGYQYSILQFLKSKDNKKLSKLSLNSQLQSINFDRNGHYLDNYIDMEKNHIVGGRNYLQEIYLMKKSKKEDTNVKL